MISVPKSVNNRLKPNTSIKVLVVPGLLYYWNQMGYYGPVIQITVGISNG